MKPFGLDKSHKLCAKVAVDRLFADRQAARGALSYPVRAVWAENPGRIRGASVQFMITIPKKRLRHAVDRVTMRRRIREAYRLLRPSMVPEVTPCPVDIAFLYIADRLTDYHRIEGAMRHILSKIFPSEAPSETHISKDMPAMHSDEIQYHNSATYHQDSYVQK